MSTKPALLGRTAVIASLTALAIGALSPTSADARNGRWHGGGAAAGAAIAAGVIGTGLAIAASRDAYDYYDGPVYGGPAYHAAPSYYGPNPNAYGYYRKGEYPYQVYGGDSPNAVCAQGTTWNCR
ncbi:hypothetical protein HL666_28555 [Bradyrhizobium sp. 83002]|uniref:hypothetical protein n=1 Tax=Bradyrhizobium aeschynomenes TaxID=2734909 RepID=UPI001553183E|nr:hypothetical protein [Bradyrhizobium aeschynomenes]NPU14730.1 hypothetical protein [Bradyrhizobium aeschynomenes]